MPFIVSQRGRRFMNMGNEARGFLGKIKDAEIEAANAATAKSRMQYDSWISGRPLAPPRNRRPTTEGQLGNLLVWEVVGNGMIRFDRTELDEKAPYWVIQEIGSGQSAHILNPQGEVSVKSQVGRELPKGLFFWGTEGGRPATGGGLHQLYPMSQAQSDPWLHPYSEVKGTIRREIKGKHFTQRGGMEGFDVFRDQAVLAFNAAFH